MKSGPKTHVLTLSLQQHVEKKVNSNFERLIKPLAEFKLRVKLRIAVIVHHALVITVQRTCKYH